MAILGIIFGFISGLAWEWLSTSPFRNHPTLFPSMIIRLGGKRSHIHHWVDYLLIVLIALFWAYKTGRLLHPAVLMFCSFLITATAYDIWKFPDWYKFF